MIPETINALRSRRILCGRSGVALSMRGLSTVTTGHGA